MIPATPLALPITVNTSAANSWLPETNLRNDLMLLFDDGSSVLVEMIIADVVAANLLDPHEEAVFAYMS